MPEENAANIIAAATSVELMSSLMPQAPSSIQAPVHARVGGTYVQAGM